MRVYLPLLLTVVLCVVACSGQHESTRILTPTATPDPFDQVAPFIEGYGPVVKQATLERRGRDLYAEITIEQDAGETEAERVLDHAMDVIEQAIVASDDWYNYNIRVFYPDGTGSVSVTADAIEMFRE